MESDLYISSKLLRGQLGKEWKTNKAYLEWFINDIKRHILKSQITLTPEGVKIDCYTVSVENGDTYVRGHVDTTRFHKIEGMQIIYE